MLIEDTINNLVWIDVAFSKDYVDELEAVCCLTEGQNKVLFGNEVSGYSVDHQVNPTLRTNYKTLLTWNMPGHSLLSFINKAISKRLQNFRRGFLLEKCEELFHSMSPTKQALFILEYYYIAHALNLGMNKETGILFDKSKSLDNTAAITPLESTSETVPREKNQKSQHYVENDIKPALESITGIDVKPQPEPEPSSDEDAPWENEAKKIFYELGLDRSNFSQGKCAEKIAKEMARRLKAGDTKMAKRGGKKAPSVSTICRHVLQNLQ